MSYITIYTSRASKENTYSNRKYLTSWGGGKETVPIFLVTNYATCPAMIGSGSHVLQLVTTRVFCYIQDWRAVVCYMRGSCAWWFSRTTSFLCYYFINTMRCCMIACFILPLLLNTRPQDSSCCESFRIFSNTILIFSENIMIFLIAHRAVNIQHSWLVE